MATTQFVCVNWNLNSTDCKKIGRYSCKNCYLVAYCGPSCQKSHWALHKIDCKSSFGKGIWNPDWVLENRNPAFVGNDGLGVQFGGKKYLWGNIPALDVLQLGSNEGDDYRGRLNLLFAASGDLRNVAKTIAQIPSSYKQPVNITVNDRDIGIVARNAILLLVALVVDDIDEAADCMTHIWYSVLIRESDLNILQKQIRPLIQSICEKVKSERPDSDWGKTWTFGRRSLRLVLAKSSWDSLLSYLDIPEGLTAERATQIRTAVTLAESRKDYRDRHLLLQKPPRRIAKSRFWEDGLLLPFGSRRHEFREPNPTFFQTTDTWPMHDNADPLNGWSLKEVEDTSSGPAAADIYGKLFYHVRTVLRAFLLRLVGLEVSFQLHQLDASDLPEKLGEVCFSRIEVSNIADSVYLGLPRTIAFMVPLLEGPLINPHATLVTLLMNTVDENTTDQDRNSNMTSHSATTRRLIKYLPPRTSSSNGRFDPGVMKMLLARDIVESHGHIFDRFMKKFPFTEVAQYVRAVMKEKNTIIEKWPFELKLQPGQPGAQEEFDRLLSGGVSGKERYIEWKRI